MKGAYIEPKLLLARMMERVVKTPGGCWVFAGCVNSRGYGCVGSGKKGKSVLTHRLAVFVRDGALADDMTVDHLCHDAGRCPGGVGCIHRRCVNPDHLAVVTRAANSSRAAHERSHPWLAA